MDKFLVAFAILPLAPTPFACRFEYRPYEARLEVESKFLVGETTTVHVSATEPNARIRIEINGGGEPAETTSVEIVTGANVSGSTTWLVPEWRGVKFNTNWAEEVSRTIASPDEVAATGSR